MLLATTGGRASKCVFVSRKCLFSMSFFIIHLICNSGSSMQAYEAPQHTCTFYMSQSWQQLPPCRYACEGPECFM